MVGTSLFLLAFALRVLRPVALFKRTSLGEAMQISRLNKKICNEKRGLRPPGGSAISRDQLRRTRVRVASDRTFVRRKFVSGIRLRANICTPERTFALERIEQTFAGNPFPVFDF